MPGDLMELVADKAKELEMPYDLTENLTDFVTPFGHYWYLVVAQGLVVSMDAYNQCFDNIIKDFPNLACNIDDRILWDTNLVSHVLTTCAYISAC